ncbi:unnamed protein product [Bemisia tabaci]|uniref:Uncharacterized protein n=1 Tax=Bemisia tabaci TaxID=7038 RepID=A0A9P0EXY7_BEMTA|nr:PREDICTED: uncharacterized protein LOC109032007 [Bemisia tabaci]CAH0383840.1 unnamed protein product [Bemisia tabaci]
MPHLDEEVMSTIIEREIAVVKADIKEEIKQSKAHTSFPLAKNEDSIINEVLERQRRSTNIIVFNLSDDSNLETDLLFVKDLLAPSELDLSKIRVSRIGIKEQKQG